MTQLSNSLKFFTNHTDYFLEQYQRLVRIPSVSTDKEHNADMLAACEFLADKLRGLGAGRRFSDQSSTIFLYGNARGYRKALRLF